MAAVTQLVGDDDFDDDYSEEDDVDDPELAVYLDVPERPTLGDYLLPALEEEKQRRRAAKSRRRKLTRAARTQADVVEHTERRKLNEDGRKLVKAVTPLEVGLSNATGTARISIRRLDDKKGRAGQCKAFIKGDANAIWETRKEAINTLISRLREELKAGAPVLEALDDEGPYADLAVPTGELKAKLRQMEQFLQNCQVPLQALNKLLEDATEQIRWMDELIALKKDTKGAPEILYPNVRIHKVLKGCPFFNNIPFDELNAQTATGTHGKSGHGAFVHKKVAGGFAITFGYVGNLAYVIDWGPKAPNSQKYSYKRGGEAYDSGAGIGEAKDLLQV